MKRRVGILYKTPIVEGDPNEVNDNEILIQKDTSTDEISSLQKRSSEGFEDIIKLPSNIVKVPIFNAEEFELYLVSSLSATATVTAVKPLTQWTDLVVELDATDLVSGSAGNYSLQFYFVIDKKGTYSVGDNIDITKTFFIITYSDDDDQPSISLGTGDKHRAISYYGEIDEEETYKFTIMIAVFPWSSAILPKPMLYYGSLRVFVDTSSLG